MMNVTQMFGRREVGFFLFVSVFFAPSVEQQFMVEKLIIYGLIILIDAKGSSAHA